MVGDAGHNTSKGKRRRETKRDIKGDRTDSLDEKRRGGGASCFEDERLKGQNRSR